MHILKKSPNQPTPLFELITLFVLAALTIWSVGPLLEEWGLLNAFNNNGLNLLLQTLPSLAMRPLNLLPFAMQWIIGNGGPAGVGVVVAVLLITRYLVARWAVSPVIKGCSLWVFCTLCAVLVAWPGVWLGRFSAAHLAAIFFFGLLGCAIRLHQQQSAAWTICGTAAVLLLLMTYQGLAICLTAVPIIFFFWDSHSGTNKNNENQSSRLRKVFRISLPVILGFGIYGLYLLIILNKYNHTGYESGLSAGMQDLMSIEGLLLHIQQSFNTAYGNDSFILPLYLLLAIFLYHVHSAARITLKVYLIELGVIFLAIISLPLLSIIYVSDLHIRDIDRVLYPVSVGFLLICLTILARQRTSLPDAREKWTTPIIIFPVLLAAGLTAHKINFYSEIQGDLTEGILKAASNSKIESIVIQDTSGLLGDVYTLLNPTLTDALAVYGRDISAIICTPANIDRIHPVARRYPINSTQRCEELTTTPINATVFTARIANGRIAIK